MESHAFQPLVGSGWEEGVPILHSGLPPPHHGPAAGHSAPAPHSAFSFRVAGPRDGPGGAAFPGWGNATRHTNGGGNQVPTHFVWAGPGKNMVVLGCPPHLQTHGQAQAQAQASPIGPTLAASFDVAPAVARVRRRRRATAGPDEWLHPKQPLQQQQRRHEGDHKGSGSGSNPSPIVVVLRGDQGSVDGGSQPR